MAEDPVRQAVHAALDAVHPGGALGIAVSGGGDSVALMLLAHDWASARNFPLLIATVDHGLRPESAAEAAGVAAAAAELGREADILRWTGWDGRGNIQGAARAARRRLLAGWARKRSLSAIALGHTMDDQAETVLMRLGRGAGVDGLSGMAAVSEGEGATWLRPLLGQRRAALRDWLAARGAEWVDDPSNDDPRYDRVRVRKALETLGGLGVGVPGLAAAADRMGEAREALDHGAAALATEAATWGACGELRLSLAPLRAAPKELTRRLVRAGLTRVAGAGYGPRAEAEARLVTDMLGLRLGGGRSLHGCLIRPDGPAGVVLMRETAAIDADPAPPPAAGLWDGRFAVEIRAPLNGALVAPVGAVGAQWLDELAARGDWRPSPEWSAAPKAARIATPGLWRGGALTAAPLAGYGDAITARFVGPGG